MTNQGTVSLSRPHFILLVLALLLFGGIFGAGTYYLLSTGAPEMPEEKVYEVTGEVFLQLRNGDIRFALGADVYIFNLTSPRGMEVSDKLREIGLSPSLENMSVKELVDNLRRIPLDLYYKKYPAESFDHPIEKRIGGDRKYLITCDSTGRFTVTLPEGGYSIVASGRAGINEAVWSKTISVPEETKISLSSPLAAYSE